MLSCCFGKRTSCRTQEEESANKPSHPAGSSPTVSGNGELTATAKAPFQESSTCEATNQGSPVDFERGAVSSEEVRLSEVMVKSDRDPGHEFEDNEPCSPRKELSLSPSATVTWHREHTSEHGANGGAGTRPLAGLVDTDVTPRRFVKVRKLGSGSYAKVVLYETPEDGKLHAIKVFDKNRLMKKRKGSAAGNALDDCLHEAKAMQKLDHPHVVALEQVIDDPEAGKLYLVLEYLPGGPVMLEADAERRDRADSYASQDSAGDCSPAPARPAGSVPYRSRLPEERCRAIMQDCLAGLQYVHAQGVAHLDVKPQNLLQGVGGAVKLSDFGASQAVAPQDTLYRTPGTPAFVAPECLDEACPHYSGKAADMWALGLTLYLLLFGTHPFEAPNLGQIFQRIQTETITLPSGLEYSAPCSDFLNRCLTRAPAERLTVEQALSHPWITVATGLQGAAAA